MFDVLQISWWLIEATLLGLLCNRKFFDNNTDRLLFAPITGFACVLILGNMLWMQAISTHFMSFLLVAALVFAVIYLVREWPGQPVGMPLWLAGGAMVVILHGSLIPFSEKLFQAFPLDRFFYLGASILFEKETMSYFGDALQRLAFNGDKRAYFLHPLLPLAVSEFKVRPASEIAFVLFSWATPRELYRLANAWEVFLRVLQFSGVLALFWKGLGPRFLSGFLALAAVFGYWFQYTKDFNAWGSSTCLALAISLVALVILMLDNGKVDSRNRYFAYLLALAAVISYPEFGPPVCIGLLVMICANKILRTGILIGKRIWLEFAGFSAAVFAVHPFIIAFMKRQFGLAPSMVGGEEAMSRGIYRLFATLGERREFAHQIAAHPLRLITDPVAFSDMTIGTFLFPYVSYWGGPATLVVALLIVGLLIWSVITRIKPDLLARPQRKVVAALVMITVYAPLFVILRKSHLENRLGLAQPASLVLGALVVGLVVWSAIKTTRPNLRILLVLVAFYVAFFVGLLLWGKVGGSYRSFPFWGGFASIAFLILLAASESKILHVLAVMVACTHLIFGASIFYVTNKKGLETYPAFYPNATGVRHFEIPTIRDKYDFDYTSIIPQLKLCSSVFLNLPQNVSKELFAPRYHAVNLMFFLENNDIRYYLSMPYRNASPLIAGEFHPGFSKEEVKADCTVEEEVRNGRISYKFVQTKWY